MSANIDLFENWQTLPETMQNVLNKYAEIEHDYTTLEAMQRECEALGYTFDFGLDCVPYDLHKVEIYVNKQPNGQYVVKMGRFTLTQTVTIFDKINECTEDKFDYVQLCEPNDPRFKPLFIALHNFKNQQL